LRGRTALGSLGPLDLGPGVFFRSFGTPTDESFRSGLSTGGLPNLPGGSLLFPCRYFPFRKSVLFLFCLPRQFHLSFDGLSILGPHVSSPGSVNATLFFRLTLPVNTARRCVLHSAIFFLFLGHRRRAIRDFFFSDSLTPGSAHRFIRLEIFSPPPAEDLCCDGFRKGYKIFFVIPPRFVRSAPLSSRGWLASSRLPFLHFRTVDARGSLHRAVPYLRSALAPVFFFRPRPALLPRSNAWEEPAYDFPFQTSRSSFHFGADLPKLAPVPPPLTQPLQCLPSPPPNFLLARYLISSCPFCL